MLRLKTAQRKRGLVLSVTLILIISGIEELYSERIQHLKPCHLNYFKKWNAMIDLEVRAVLKGRQEIWTQSPTEREAEGKALTQLELVDQSPMQNSNSLKYLAIFRSMYDT